jgi:hypothetical protein
MAETGSVQMRRYRTAREFGHSRADAAAYADLPMEEAKLWDIDWGFDLAPTTTKENARV